MLYDLSHYHINGKKITDKKFQKYFCVFFAYHTHTYIHTHTRTVLAVNMGCLKYSYSTVI